MKNKLYNLLNSNFLQIFILFFINCLFILKYVGRTSFSPYIPLIGYLGVISIILFLFSKFSHKINPILFKYFSWFLLIISAILIVFILYKVDKMNVNVDRWSAVTYFLDYLFKGDYPYAASTHTSATNFPSPFPFWHIINIPFYFMGDVGIGLLFFLALLSYTVYKFNDGWTKETFLFLLLLLTSPAYWWEVWVRSDSLSNVILVFSFIVLFYKSGSNLNKNFLFTIVACGLIATTRLSAILPVAIFFFNPYWKLPIRKKIIFPFAILLIGIGIFLPFILWDTENWIFFQRNPFMSQTSVGHPVALIILMILGIILSLLWKNINEFFKYTSLFIFIFIMTSQIMLVVMKGINVSIFEDKTYDISYFTLALPYTLMGISYFKRKDN